MWSARWFFVCLVFWFVCLFSVKHCKAQSSRSRSMSEREIVKTDTERLRDNMSTKKEIQADGRTKTDLNGQMDGVKMDGMQTVDRWMG